MYALSDFQHALVNVRKVIPPTPLKYSKWLSELTEKNIYLKLETVNPGNSFKIRGVTNFLYTYRDTYQQFPEKVVSASGGNHGLAVAIIAQQLQIPCKIVLPVNSPQYRIDLLQSYNAEVELFGDVWDDANIYAQQLLDEHSAYIPPFSHEWVIHGQGTIGLEVFQQNPAITTIIGSIGGGGLMAGTAASFKLNNSNSLVYGVETIGADYYSQSRKAKKLIQLDGITSIAKSLGAKTGTDNVFQLLNTYIDQTFTVPDKLAVQMMRDFLEHEQLLIEPATSCSVAALLNNAIEGDNIAVIICGSNSTYTEFLKWQQQFGITAK